MLNGLWISDCIIEICLFSVYYFIIHCVASLACCLQVSLESTKFICSHGFISIAITDLRDVNLCSENDLYY